MKRKLAFVAFLIIVFWLAFGAAKALAVPSGQGIAIGNQGLGIENDLSIYTLTKNLAYLNDAENLALVYMAQPAAQERWAEQQVKPQQAINEVIFIRALRRLNNVRPIPGYAIYLQAFEQTLKSFNVSGPRLTPKGMKLIEEPGKRVSRTIYAWPAAQVYTAAFEDGVRGPVEALRFYYSKAERAFAVAIKLGKKREVIPVYFCDDNDWVGLAFEQAWRGDHRKFNLNYAKDVAMFENGPCWNENFGGDRWVLDPNNTELSTVSTAAAEQLNWRLYLDTHQVKYLIYAERDDQWIRLHMEAPDGSLYDHLFVTPAGLAWEVPGPQAEHPWSKQIKEGRTAVVDPVSLLAAELQIQADLKHYRPHKRHKRR